MKKKLIFLVLPVFLLSGCLIKNNSQDIIKITSEKNSNKINKSLSLSVGVELLNSGKTDSAIQYFNDCREYYSQNSDFYYYLGQAYFKNNKFTEAAGNFEKALAIDNKRYKLFLEIANAYEKANIKNKAVENYVSYIFKSDDTLKISEIRNKLNDLAAESIGNNIIGRISVTDKADMIKNTAIGAMQAFNPDTPLIFASVELINPQKTDKVQVEWNYISVNEEIIPVNVSEFYSDKSKTVLLSIKSPVAGWPPGKYEMRVLVNGIKNSSLNFYIF